jgi:hypothetical protein
VTFGSLSPASSREVLAIRMSLLMVGSAIHHAAVTEGKNALAE